MFFYIRNRSVRIIILGFVILSIYMYYRTTVDSYNNFIEFVNTSKNLFILIILNDAESKRHSRIIMFSLTNSLSLE